MKHEENPISHSCIGNGGVEPGFHFLRDSAAVKVRIRAAQQASVRDMANKALADLYAKNPAAKSEISKAAGYAVFSDVGVKFIFMGGAGGSGVAVNNVSKQETFMKMAEFQPGLGFGAAKFRVVFIFETQEAFDSFVTSGWEAGANAMATAKTKGEGGAIAGAITVSKGVKMIQLND